MIIMLFAIVCVFIFLLFTNNNQEGIKNGNVKQIIHNWENKIKNRLTDSLNSINTLKTAIRNTSCHIADIIPKVESQSTIDTDEFSDNLHKLYNDIKTTTGKNRLSLQDLFNTIKTAFKEINNVAVKQIINHIPEDKINSFEEKIRGLYNDINEVDSLMLKVDRNLKSQKNSVENIISTLNFILAHLEQHDTNV